jgi:hypothetical protein
MTEEKGRESREANALFYVCSLIEFIARMTKNRRNFVAARLGEAKLRKMFDLADVYHSDNIERVASDFIAASEIETGSYDNVSKCRYSVPSHWDIGKVYKRLILGAAAENSADIIETLIAVYNSFVSEKIDDYNSSFYYESPQYILNTYLTGHME